MIRIGDIQERIYDPETGEGISSTAAVEEFLYLPNAEDYFISFTKIDKIGINPQSKYETPIGIYAYPLVEYFERYNPQIDQSIGKVAPFAGDAPFVNVVEVDRSKGRFIDDIGDYDEYDLEGDRNRLIKVFGARDLFLAIQNIDFRTAKEFRNFIKQELGWKSEGELARYKDEMLSAMEAFVREKFDQWEEDAHLPSYSGARFWNITRMLAKGFDGEDAVQWNKILRKLRYIGVADKSGTGIIHTSEPFQAVFFNRSFIDVVDRIENVGAPAVSNEKVLEATIKGVEFVIDTMLETNFEKPSTRALIRDYLFDVVMREWSTRKVNHYSIGYSLPQAFQAAVEKMQDTIEQYTEEHDKSIANIYKNLVMAFLAGVRSSNSDDFRTGWNTASKDYPIFNKFTKGQLKV